MKWFVGTSGFSYKKWKGTFYPEDLPDKEMLRYYGEQLPAVEINNTFYRLPKASMLEGWLEQVPGDFRFVLKASRKITHIKPLKEKADETNYLFKTAATLGNGLGAILFQLPPYLRKNVDLLDNFLALLPADRRATFEFRHRSWFDDEVYDRLRQKGCALCCADSENEELSQLVATASWGYLRLRKPDYTDKDLAEWADLIKAQDWQEVYVFFKHEDEGTGPRLAKRFLEMAEH